MGLAAKEQKAIERINVWRVDLERTEKVRSGHRRLRKSKGSNTREVRAKVVKIYSRTGWKEPGKGIKVCGEMKPQEPTSRVKNWGK